jgi:hypothetical protein
MKRSPAAAVWLSLLPGLGHIFIGQALPNRAARKAYVTKGFLYALMTVGLIYLANHADGPFGLLIPIFWVYVMLDAHRSAVETNRVIEAGEKDPPRAMDETPWLGWSAVGLGALLLLNNLFDLDFDWLWRFWPVALILVGVKLIRGSGLKSDLVSPPPNNVDANSALEGERDERAEDE